MIDVIFRILLTAISYMAIPLVFAIAYKKPLSKRFAILLVAINGLVVFMLFSYIDFFILDMQKGGNNTAAFIWSALVYAIIKNISSNKKYELENISPSTAIQQEDAWHNNYKDEFSENSEERLYTSSNNRVYEPKKSYNKLILFSGAAICVIVIATYLLTTSLPRSEREANDGICGTWVYQEREFYSTWSFSDDNTFAMVYGSDTSTGKYRYIKSVNEVVLFYNDTQATISVILADDLLRVQISENNKPIYYNRRP